ncbi:MAG: flagellar hook capping FlgD N-terminal domain-containing protein [Hungatella hathewayi]|uniref:flagellar hook assembly protein FlgD n=1 Tax=Hungatella TaxID=1649459 RepID=UPI00110575C1|nr:MULTISPECIES: flagellar hook capping FlgD N-terminal domain-containing protein [Hungatella]MCI7383537.1 flagellar hook capping protein [Hungatella sp.]MDY6238139.1 flagellar hook capping FlgD N-terminal domain-containing protein [Hungatella hathewayi]
MSVQIPEYSNPYLRTASSGSSGPGVPGDAAPAKASEDGEKETEGANGASGNGDVIDAVFGDASDKAVSMEDFLTLMVAQLKNQDFMNPVDDTQYVTQLAQISTMQQMEEMAYNAKSTYVTSLVGKTVTAAKFTVAGDLKKTEGVVNKVSLLDGKFVIYVEGESYGMDEIMEIRTEAPEKDGTEPPDSGGSGDGDGEDPGDKDSKI